jgi:phage gp29-like protein
MADPILYDYAGRPVKRQELVREHAAPSLTGVRTAWGMESVAQGLTPARLARVLRDAAEGDAREYLILAEEMEEREPHYASVLGTRKRAVSGLEPAVEAASDDAKDQEIADAVRGLVWSPQFGDMLSDCLDALGKGYSAVEIMWDRSGARWTPREYVWRDPGHFVFDRVTGRKLLLLDERDISGIPLPPYKFIAHVPKLKSGLPLRGGLARLAATAYMCKAYTLADWLAFAEVYGMPLRVGRYGPQASEEDIKTLINAVANLGTDAACVLPDSMRIEFVKEGGSQGSGGQELFLKLAEWLDKQMSKAVLGQTMTADDGSSRSQAQVHNEVRGDILRDDARCLADTVNRDLVRPYVDLNWGPQEVYPRVTLPINEPEDIAALADALSRLVPLGGLGIQASVVRDRLGFPDPEPGAELLGAAPAEAELPAQNRAMNREGPAQEVLDELEAEALADWEPLATPARDALQDLADRSASFDEFLAGLPGLAGSMAPQELVTRLAEAAFKARGAGDAEG